MDDLLRDLIQVPGVPGHEDRVRDLIREHLPDGVETSTDHMGNLVATIGEGDRSILFAAHMDEIGFVVSEVAEEGFLKIRPLGGIDPRTVFGRALRVLTDDGEVPGVVVVVPPHLMRDRQQEANEIPKVEDLFLDVGAGSEEEVAKLGVRVLDFAVLEKSVTELHGNRVAARSLDDRAGCYVLLRALRELAGEGPPCRVHFAFSTQEEVGLRGASLLARTLDVDLAFAVDTASTGDYPGAGKDKSPAVLGGGPCLRVLDSRMVVPRALVREVEQVAEKAGIQVQIMFSGGGTDAAAFQTEGPRALPLGIPMRYTHSAVETISLDDLEKTVALALALVGSMG